MIAVFTDVVADTFGFCAVNEVLAQPSLDALEIFLKRFFGAVVADQVLQHVARELIHPRVEGQPFVNDFA